MHQNKEEIRTHSYSYHSDMVESYLLQECKSKVDLQGWWIVQMNLPLISSQAKIHLFLFAFALKLRPPFLRPKVSFKRQ